MFFEHHGMASAIRLGVDTERETGKDSDNTVDKKIKGKTNGDTGGARNGADHLPNFHPAAASERPILSLPLPRAAGRSRRLHVSLYPARSRSETARGVPARPRSARIPYGGDHPCRRRRRPPRRRSSSSPSSPPRARGRRSARGRPPPQQSCATRPPPARRRTPRGPGVATPASWR